MLLPCRANHPWRLDSRLSRFLEDAICFRCSQMSRNCSDMVSNPILHRGRVNRPTMVILTFAGKSSLSIREECSCLWNSLLGTVSERAHHNQPNCPVARFQIYLRQIVGLCSTGERRQRRSALVQGLVVHLDRRHTRQRARLGFSADVNLPLCTLRPLFAFRSLVARQ
jgi:hypothetical protein